MELDEAKRTQWFFFRVVTMYRPCFSNGPLTTYQQQVRYLTKIGRFLNPREAILIDIAKELQTWQELGDHILLLMDYNDDIESPTVRQWAAQLGLVEAITYLHPTGAPPTYQHGSRPIDGIFAAPQLLAQAAGGYLSFGDAVPSDHRAIWLDLHLPEICPPQQADHVKPRARRLQCKDPRVVSRYNTVLLDIIMQQNIPDRLSQLNGILHGPNGPSAKIQKRTEHHRPDNNRSQKGRGKPMPEIEMRKSSMVPKDYKSHQ